MWLVFLLDLQVLITQQATPGRDSNMNNKYTIFQDTQDFQLGAFKKIFRSVLGAFQLQ